MWVPVTITWYVLRLWVKNMASTYGGELQIYLISSHRQTIRGGPPAWGLGKGLTTPHCNKPVYYKMSQSALGKQQ
jgi:hypothetical protein